jgi:hypothetical protein
MAPRHASFSFCGIGLVVASTERLKSQQRTSLALSVPLPD